MKSKDIAIKIRELRKALKLTQSQFAERVNLSEDSIGKIERGIGVPTLDTLNKIASGLKMPVEDLLSTLKKKPSQKPSGPLSDLMAYLQTRSPEDIRFIHEIAVKILERKL